MAPDTSASSTRLPAPRDAPLEGDRSDPSGTASHGDQPRRHRWAPAMVVLRLLVVPAVLVAGWFLARTQGLDLRPTGGVHLLMGALLVNQLAILIIGWRMGVSLRLFGIGIPARDALRIGIQSQFYFFFVPVSASNEVARYLKIRAIRPHTGMHTLVVSLLLDRMLGLVACIAVALAVLPFTEIRPIAGIQVPPAGVAAAIAAGAAAVAVVAWRLGWLARLREAIRETRGRRALIVPAGILVLLMQVSTILSVWLAAEWLGIETSVAALAVGISLGTLGQVIPFTFAGAGPAEVTGAAVFMALGATPVESAALAALVYMTRLMAAIEGGLWEMLQGARNLRARSAA